MARFRTKTEDLHQYLTDYEQQHFSEWLDSVENDLEASSPPPEPRFATAPFPQSPTLPRTTSPRTHRHTSHGSIPLILLLLFRSHPFSFSALPASPCMTPLNLVLLPSYTSPLG